jgi:hypothetical protein
MKLKRICRCCKKEFIAQKIKQWYCSRKCFKQDYFKRSKDKPGNYPTFMCEDCGRETILRIDPVKDEFFWTDFKCPHCNPKLKKNIIVIKTSKGITVAF